MQKLMPGLNRIAFISDGRYISSMVRREVDRVMKDSFPYLQINMLCSLDMTTESLLDSLMHL